MPFDALYGVQTFLTSEAYSGTAHNAMVAAMLGRWAAMGDLLGQGFFAATDYAVTTPGGLGVAVSPGRALVGPAGARKYVAASASQTFTGLTPSTTYGVYARQDGLCECVAAGGSVPASSALAATFTTTADAVTSIVNLPDGRVNLEGAFPRRGVVTFATTLTLPSTGVNYYCGLDFAAFATFADVGYHAVLTLDAPAAAGVHVKESTARKTVGVCGWEIYSEAVEYGGSVSLAVTATLVGPLATEPGGAVTWAAPVVIY